jgi:hypothetical protein
MIRRIPGKEGAKQTGMRTASALLLSCGILLSTSLLASCVTVQSTSQEPYYETEYATENNTEPHSETVAVTREVTHEETIQPYMLWSNPQLLFNERRSIWYYGYNLPPDPPGKKQILRITFFRQQFYEYVAISVFDMDPRGQILAPPLISPSENVTTAVAQRKWISSKLDIATYKTWFNVTNLKLDWAHFLGGKNDMFLNSATAAPLEIEPRDSRQVAMIISGPTDPQNCRFAATRVWAETVTENITRTVERPVPVQTGHQVLKYRTSVQTRQVPFWESYVPSRP